MNENKEKTAGNLANSVVEGYDYSVAVRMSGRAGAYSPTGGKGNAFEVMYSDKKNLSNLLKPDTTTTLTNSSTARQVDLVTKKGNRIIERIQCKDTPSAKGTMDTIKYKDIAVTSVYVEEAEEIQKEVSILCDVSYANGKVKFLSKYSVPTDADYKVIKAGVVATDSTGYAAIQEVQQELTLDTTATTRLKKYGVNTDLYLANFTQYLKTSRTTTWYARGYVTYQDNSGEQHTVYSDMAQYTIR